VSIAACLEKGGLLDCARGETTKHSRSPGNHQHPRGSERLGLSVEASRSGGTKNCERVLAGSRGGTDAGDGAAGGLTENQIAIASQLGRATP